MERSEPFEYWYSFFFFFQTQDNLQNKRPHKAFPASLNPCVFPVQHRELIVSSLLKHEQRFCSQKRSH